jgi:glycosyltransferase involved in cell wall biosynthesis
MPNMPSLTPLVSVVIPCYNAAAFLQETMDSVWRQTYPALEVILIDDGSTDSTRSLIESWGNRVTALYGPNRGAAAARNTGTRAAHGEYIQYLDADDLLEPDAIASRIQALTLASASVAYSDWQRLEETDPGVFKAGEVVARRIEDVHPDIEVALFSTFWSPPAALLYKSDLVDRAGEWKQHLAPIEDARFLLDAALAGGRFAHVPGVGARYRVFHAPSHSRRDPLAFVRAVLRNALEIEAIWRARGPLAAAHARALADCYNYAARSLFRNEGVLFQQALAHLNALQPGFTPVWPRAAAALQRLLGHSASLRVLDMLGRPAP